MRTATNPAARPRSRNEMEGGLVGTDVVAGGGVIDASPRRQEDIGACLDGVLPVETPQKVGEDVGLMPLVQQPEPTFLIHLDPPGTEHLLHVRLSQSLSDNRPAVRAPRQGVQGQHWLRASRRSQPGRRDGGAGRGGSRLNQAPGAIAGDDVARLAWSAKSKAGSSIQRKASPFNVASRTSVRASASS